MLGCFGPVQRKNEEKAKAEHMHEQEQQGKKAKAQDQPARKRSRECTCSREGNNKPGHQHGRATPSKSNAEPQDPIAHAHSRQQAASRQHGQLAICLLVIIFFQASEQTMYVRGTLAVNRQKLPVKLLCGMDVGRSLLCCLPSVFACSWKHGAVPQNIFLWVPEFGQFAPFRKFKFWAVATSTYLFRVRICFQACRTLVFGPRCC